MYVDESGDPGKYNPGANSQYFILSGLIVDHMDWASDFAAIKRLRDLLRADHGFSVRLELHGSDFVSVRKYKEYSVYKKAVRMSILKQVVQQIPSILPNARIINVCLDKEALPQYTNYQEVAWNRLIQRFDTHLKKDAAEWGMVFADNTDNSRIVNLMRRMRAYNPVPSKYTEGLIFSSPTTSIIEDPVFRDSAQSHFVQIADCIVTSLRLKEYPKGALRKYDAHRYFDFLDPLLIKAASTSDPLGIVRA